MSNKYDAKAPECFSEKLNHKPKKKFRVNVTQDMYQCGHVDIEADSADEARSLMGYDDYWDSVIWGEFNDDGELCIQDVRELKDEK